MKNSSLTNAERLALVMAAKMVIETNLQDPDQSYPEDVVMMLDLINDDHLASYLTESISDHIRKPVMQALFADFPIVLEEIETQDEAFNINDYLKALEEKIGARRLTVRELYSALCTGKNATVTSQHINKNTGEFVYERRFYLNGHTAQRRAALVNEVCMYRTFPEYIDWEINLLKGMIENGK